jgi:hypothetical protein
VLAKFRTLTGGIVAPDRLARIEDRVLNIEKLGDIKELAGVLGEPVEPVFH